MLYMGSECHLDQDSADVHRQMSFDDLNYTEAVWEADFSHGHCLTTTGPVFEMERV